MPFYPISDTCQIKGLAEIYEKVLGQKTNGVFVDVGAYDGYVWSNTWGLAEIGWSGICFEPMHELAEKARAMYAKIPVEVSECAIGDTCGSVKLYTHGNPTIDEETVEKSPWGYEYDKSQYIEVIGMTLDKALLAFDCPPSFDVLSIDVEGAELKVLAGFNWLYWLPKMIIIEDHEGHEDSRRSFHADATRAWFEKTLYKRIHADKLNSIYVLELENAI